MEIFPPSTAETTTPTTATTSSSNYSFNDDNSSPCTSGKRIDISEAEQQSNLVKCDWCERSFNPARLEIHQRSCTKESPAKKIGAPLKEKWQTKLAEQRNANLQKLSKNDTKPSMDNSLKAEMSDINFKYADEDSYEAELAELYSYSEMKEGATNLESFLKYTDDHNYPQQFNTMELKLKKRIIGDVLEMLESAESSVRLEAARLVLYILQGAYGDFCTINEDEENSDELSQNKGKSGYEHGCLHNGVINAYFCYQQGLYPALCTMLLHEIQKPFKGCAYKSKFQMASMSDSCPSTSNIDNVDISSDEHQNKQPATLADNESIRVVLSCIYHMVEAIKRESWIHEVSSKSHYSINELKNLRKQFLTELEEPLDDAKIPLIIVLFDMMPSFVRSENPHYPMKKILLLIWKIILSTLGSFEELKEEKMRQRKKHNLQIMEDTIEVGSQMKAIRVGTDGEFVDYPGVKNRSSSPRRFISRQLACTPVDGSKDGKDDDQSADISELEDKMSKNDEFPNAKAEESTPPSDNNRYDTIPSKKLKLTGNVTYQKFDCFEDNNSKNATNTRSTLPWKPKISESQIEAFLQKAREKFLGYRIPSDLTTTFGLPPSINLSMEIFHQHLYKSLGEIQIEDDIKYNRFPFTQKETIPNIPTERFYASLLPKIGDYLVALLKILFAALPNSKSSDGFSILSDILTQETKNYERLSQSVNMDATTDTVSKNHDRIELDIARHKEIIVKSISGILILLLKWLKLNHIYQFEFIVQKLLLLNCVPLLLKFLDQNMIEYIQAKNEFPEFNYPTAPILFIRNGKQWQTLSAENLESSDSKNYYCWRNIFSSINIVRVLNKITKGKQSRTLMLVVFKSTPILKRCLKVQCSLFQLYCLKLLKLQCRYLGNQWRKANMDLVSTIYIRVRHRLNDDWAYAHETRINNNQMDYQIEENDLKLAVEKFHFRRYSKLYPKFKCDMKETTNNSSKDYFDLTFIDDFVPVNNCLQSMLSSETVFSQRFKRNYEKWLNDEVYGRSVDWDSWLIKTERISTLLQEKK